jgi:hypothetical protein
MTGPRISLFPLWLLVGSSLLPAVSPLAPQGTLPAEGAVLPADSRAASEGILVMRTGAIIQGKILQSGGVYDVQTANGKMAVPETLVKIRAANLTEAYEQLHDGAVAQQSANAHVLLAQWCLTNQLHKEALTESHAALKLEPDREDAKRLIRNAEEALQEGEAPSPSVVVHEDPARVARQAAAADDAVSLGGISREQALQFARRIQPLLVNNCTAAGCHGRESQTGFRLSKVTPGKDANRHAAERNLAEVLEWIDVKKPRSSRLLTAPRGNHGRRGRPVFAGSRGDEQLAELEKWIVAVAAEEIVRDRHDQDDARPKKAVRQVSAGSADNQAPRTDRTAGSRNAAAVEKPSRSPAPNVSRPSQPPLPAGHGDPFDAAVFNRGADRSVR